MEGVRTGLEMVNPRVFKLDIACGCLRFLLPVSHLSDKGRGCYLIGERD